MKGKDIFSTESINKVKALINLRSNTPASGQKAIRQQMRDLGFYGKDDWGIVNLQISDFETLLQSGKIKISDKPTEPKVTTSITPKIITSKITVTRQAVSYLDIDTILEDFGKHRFDPVVDNEMKVENYAGNYIVCLRTSSALPKAPVTPVLKSFDGLQVIYTGIASVSLRTRDYRQHFKGNAGRSTLRKSLGVLFGYKQRPRDKSLTNGKTKFEYKDEQALSEWMRLNLIMFALPTANCNGVENLLINHFNPPLNLKDNKNQINLDFRRLLSNLRNQAFFDLSVNRL